MRTPKVRVIHQDELGVDNGPWKWLTFCSQHAEFIGHETRQLARDWAAFSDEWCGECATMTQTQN